MNDVGVFSFGRTGSRRCPNKMLRPFGETTLTDLVLSKLAPFGPAAFFAGYEDEFCAKAERHGVRFVKRDRASVTCDGPITAILSFLRGIEPRYVLLVSGCVPFLQPRTITAFLERCLGDGCRPAISVRTRRKHFVRQDGTAANFTPAVGTLNTKMVEPLCELVDALYFFDRMYFFEHGAYWDWRAVRLIELADPLETMDIDEEADFAFVESLWKAGYGRPIKLKETAHESA